MTLLQEFCQKLRNAGYKATPGRLAILTTLAQTTNPQNITDLIRKLKHTTIDQATIYRALKVLEKIKLVRLVELRQGSTYYELSDPDDHHHIVCINCNIIEDFSGCNIKKIQTQALKTSKNFIEILDHSFELFGICKKCMKKTQRRKLPKIN